MSLSVLGLLLSSLSVAFLPQEPSGSPLLAEERFSSALWVSLASVKARILDEEGIPISDLKPEDLRVRVGLSSMPVVAIDYYDEVVPPEAATDEKVADEVSGGRQGFFSAHQVSARGQLFVFFVDADLRDQEKWPQTTRYLRRLADSLDPSQLAAVVSLDSRLKLHLDLTPDREALYQAFLRARRGDAGTTRPAVVREHSLWHGWNETAADATRYSEDAVAATAAALDSLPGEKVLIYLLQGPGHFQRRRTNKPSPQTLAAAWALREARTTLFAFDWGRGRFSVPAPALRHMAKGTGGTYREVRQPNWKAAVDTLVNETRGYHIISFRLERLPRRPGTLPLTVELVGREGKILAPSFEIVRVRR